MVQTDPVVGDLDKNSELIREGIRDARELGCRLVLFPELSLVGYPLRDLLERTAFVEANLRALEALIPETRGIAALIGYVARNPRSSGKPNINALALVDDGRFVAQGGKNLLPSYDVFDETRYFEPFGSPLIYKLDGLRIGFTVCEDVWNDKDFWKRPIYREDPVQDLCQRGIDLLVNVSASPYYKGKISFRERMLAALARKYKVPFLYLNQVGGMDELLFDGVSMAFDREGTLTARAAEFESDLVVWDSDTDGGEIRERSDNEEASVLKALEMGLRDYVQKCGFRRALVGLSGGVDSSLVACIAARALGAGNVLGVGMPSPYTSEMSKEDARTLARNLGIRFEEIPIGPLMECFESTLAPYFKGLIADVTEENVQARIRGNILMAFSNKFGSLLLSTGNKSEMSVGYCTLYGDMCGALAVIADVPKTLCYDLCRRINEERDVIPQRVLTRPPSAELRPNQQDQDSLPPYEVLDGILYSAVELNLGLAEIVARGHDEKTVREMLRAMDLSEYKRWQAPPVLKVTTRAFGYGRRYPLARLPAVY
ncbi:MAG: NAD+ synthase [Deltaproteobacteria bacterium]|nr:NAD+ synthase [Deltaproteobacteria bacterium]